MYKLSVKRCTSYWLKDVQVLPYKMYMFLLIRYTCFALANIHLFPEPASAWRAASRPCRHRLFPCPARHSGRSEKSLGDLGGCRWEISRCARNDGAGGEGPLLGGCRWEISRCARNDGAGGEGSLFIIIKKNGRMAGCLPPVPLPAISMSRPSFRAQREISGWPWGLQGRDFSLRPE